MKCLEIIFWCSFFIVFYTFFGYGILLFFLVKIKSLFHKKINYTLPSSLPDVTLLIAAYNEESIIHAKMENCNNLLYPKNLLHIMWVTDGSSDNTNKLLSTYPNCQIIFTPERKGKTAALNHAMKNVNTPFTVFTDANTMLNPEAINEIILRFQNPNVGCVAGEKRIAVSSKDNATSGGEGFYWKYESKLKTWDSILYSTVGAAGELYAIRSDLYTDIPEDTLLDDFLLSMKITLMGYKIDYCDTAYATEYGSADLQNEHIRKVRIAAGGLQALKRLLPLFNIFKYGVLSFQYISHRVLRWTITPILFFALLPINIILASHSSLYTTMAILQIVFYLAGIIGYILQQKQIKMKVLFIPCYFIFMNLNVLQGFTYKKAKTGTWQKAKRAI